MSTGDVGTALVWDYVRYQPPLTEMVWPVMYSFVANITAIEATLSTEP